MRDQHCQGDGAGDHFLCLQGRKGLHELASSVTGHRRMEVGEIVYGTRSLNTKSCSLCFPSFFDARPSAMSSH